MGPGAGGLPGAGAGCRGMAMVSRVGVWGVWGVAGTLAVPRAGAAECEGRAGPSTPAPAPATDCTLHCTGCRSLLA